MTWNSLPEALAFLYQDKEASRRVAQDAGLDLTRIAFHDEAHTNWFNILQEAEKHGMVQAIVDIASREYQECRAELGSLFERRRNSRQIVPYSASSGALSTSRPIVDRERELQTFVAALGSLPRQAASIFLIQDQGGQGKSRLLELYKAHCQVYDFPVVHVDLKNNARDPLGILDLIQKDLGDYPLTRCAKALQAAYNNIASLSLDQQRQQWDIGARALFDDLREWKRSPQSKRVVFLFDTFEDARPETQQWIADYVLRMATPNRLPCLIVVLFGRQVPDPAGEWEPHHHRLSLQPLRMEDWLEYAQRVRANLRPEHIERIYARYAHRPLMMADTIDRFSGGGLDVR